ncbi:MULTISPECIES: CotO family spore coat protein [Bacillaceae]|uniref:CotO family spore coat protein n=1 Tax=Metabacillus sediminis TaxID=3117746 RepID=A0ABZ2NKA4_9BACI|nr:CotO family spore coat protein [Bacillus sp. SJS]KZZ83688.1 hypothetical protein AS29_015400 [Bacillus sp. SJS]
MNEKNARRQQPLMYIVQPENMQPQAQMQQVAVKKNPVKARLDKKVQEAKEIDSIEETSAEAVLDAPKTIPEEQGAAEARQNQPADEAVLAEIVKTEGDEETAITEPPKPVYERKTRKVLNQMSVVEKIAFFANLPGNIPRTLCQVELADQTYRGIIIGETDGVVHLRTTASSQPVNIRSEEIQAIQPLGF